MEESWDGSERYLSLKRESRLPKPRTQLADEFAIATRLYYEAVVAVTRNHVRRTPNEFIALREAVEKARQRSEAISERFNQHVETHGCASEDCSCGPAPRLPEWGFYE